MRIFLAPMEGVVDHYLRYILTQVGGIDLCVTEFVRVTDHILPARVFRRYCPELDFANSAPEQDKLIGARCPTRIQLLGSNVEMLAANAAKAARLGAPAIDLNFGCPAKTVNKNRGGACLLEETETLFAIVNAVRKAVPSCTPVTAKIRLGYHQRDSYLENAQAIFDAGANELIVHARSKSDGYKPPAYWECIGEIRERISIPVIANGEIWSANDFRHCQDVSGAKDFMLGRGLLANPGLANAIKNSAQTDDEFHPWENTARLLLRFFELTSQAYPKKYIGNRAKQWLFYLKRNYPQAEALFESIKRSRDYDDIHRAISEHCGEHIPNACQ